MTEIQKKIILNSLKKAGKAINIKQNSLYKQTLSISQNFDFHINADKISEEIIINALINSRLNCKIISEESEPIQNSNYEYTVYLDPLDGSVNFSYGIPFYAIGIAVYKENIPIWGAIYDIERKKMRVSDTKSPAPVLTPKSTVGIIGIEWMGSNLFEPIISKFKKRKIIIRTLGSGILTSLLIFNNSVDAVVLVDNKIWDIAPALVFAYNEDYEAVNIDGSEINLNNTDQSIIICRKHNLNQMLEIINQI